MADNQMTIGNDNNGIVNSGDNNTITQITQQPEFKTPKILTPSLGSHSNFIGRKTELKELQTKLDSNNSLLLLNGIGGIGKSSLAAYYLSQQKDNYDYYGFVEVGEGIKEAFVSIFKYSLDLRAETTDDTFNEAIIKLRKQASRLAPPVTNGSHR